MNAMRRTATGLAAVATWHLVWLLVTVDGQGLPRMNTTVAREHVGETAIVCGEVIEAGCSQKEGGSIQLATNDWQKRFAINIPSEHRGKFGPFPEEQHLQKLVCAAGRIERQDSVYTITLVDPSAIFVLPDRPGLPLFASDVARPCDPGVQLPKVRRDAKPQYTAEAMRERVEGAVAMQAVVKTDGRIGDLRVVRSLHRDLDDAAVDATRQWRFEPGTLNGQAVPVVVTIEMTFTLRDRR